MFCRMHSVGLLFNFFRCLLSTKFISFGFSFVCLCMYMSACTLCECEILFMLKYIQAQQCNKVFTFIVFIHMYSNIIIFFRSLLSEVRVCVGGDGTVEQFIIMFVFDFATRHQTCHLRYVYYTHKSSFNYRTKISTHAHTFIWCTVFFSLCRAIDINLRSACKTSIYVHWIHQIGFFVRFFYIDWVLHNDRHNYE